MPLFCQSWFVSLGFIVIMNSYKVTRFKNSQLYKALNCLTYGVKCLYYDKTEGMLGECILHIHDEFINVLQVIFNKNLTQLIRLNEIQNIADTDIALSTRFAKFNIKHFLILQTTRLDSYIIAMNSVEEKMLIWEGLQYFIIEGIMFYDKIDETDPFKAEAMMLFLEADTDGGKMLDVEEIQQIVKKMKISKTTEEIKQKVSQVNEQFYSTYGMKKPVHFDNHKLQVKSFEKLIKYFAVKTELMEIFHKYCPHFDTKLKHYPKVIQMIKVFEKPIMSPQQFVLFKKGEHFEDISLQQAQQIILSYSDSSQITAVGKEKQKSNCLSFINFCNYIFSMTNSMIDPKKMQVYQDMTLPMPNYYIYSSHNTYLSGNQLNSDSQTQMYQMALKKGCRCVELDIHDGANNIPIVKHGFTLTKAIFFEDVIKTIHDTGFVHNDYPIVLSFENHCSKQQQQVMATMIENILDDLVYQIPTTHKQLAYYPSPQSLKRRIVIKGDGKLQTIHPQQLQKSLSMPEQQPQPLQQQSQPDSGQDEEKKVELPSAPSVPSKEKKKTVKEKDAPQKNKKVENFLKLMRLVAMLNSKIDLERFKRNMWNVCSLEENKVIQLLESKQEKVIEYAKKFFIRTYPAGARVTSSNYDPMPMFNIGAHIIALNLQTPDRPHYLLHAKFLENGGSTCGYLLKPQWMLANCKEPRVPSSFDKPICELDITVLSGQKCIIAESQTSDLKLQVYLKGNTIEQKANQKFQSPVILQSGFHPIFQLNCKFTVYCPDLAMIVFNVVTPDGEQVLSSTGVSYSCLRDGLRVAPLLGPSMRFGKGSFLLVMTRRKMLI